MTADADAAADCPNPPATIAGGGGDYDDVAAAVAAVAGEDGRTWPPGFGSQVHGPDKRPVFEWPPGQRLPGPTSWANWPWRRRRRMWRVHSSRMPRMWRPMRWVMRQLQLQRHNARFP